MKVRFEAIKIGIANFIENEIASKAIGMQKFLYFGVSYLVVNNSENIMNTILSNSMLSELITQMDIIDSERNIDIEKLYQVSKYAISKSQNITIGNL
ncbi:MAG: hypothetical protein ACRCX8_15585, partial [Sarcina sp.]